MVDEVDCDQLADNLNKLNRLASAFRTGAQGGPNPAGEAQAGPRQKEQPQSQRVTREKRPAPALKTGAQLRRRFDIDDIEGQAADELEGELEWEESQRRYEEEEAQRLADEVDADRPADKRRRVATREKRPAPASGKTTGARPDPVTTGSQGKRARILGDKKLDSPKDDDDECPTTWRKLMQNGVKRRCWKCLMLFGNKQIMWKRFVTGNNDCPPPLGAPSELRITKQKAVFF